MIPHASERSFPVTGGSTVWGTVTVTTFDMPDGRKKLTRAGVVAISLTVVGLIIGIASDDLQRRADLAAEDRKRQIQFSDQQAGAVREAARTNEIITSGQPLTSLDINWRIGGAEEIGKAVEAKVELWNGMYPGDSMRNALSRHNELYPFLRLLCRRIFEAQPDKLPENAYAPSDNILVLISLDDDQNSLLPFGALTFIANKIKGKDNRTGQPPLGVEPDRDPFSETDSDLEPSAHLPYFEFEDGSANISWHLDPVTLAESLARQSKLVVPTAKLPRTLRIAILFDIHQLPFTFANFAPKSGHDFWSDTDGDSEEPDLKALAGRQFDSRIVLTANGSNLAKHLYELQKVYKGDIKDGLGMGVEGVRCLVFAFQLSA